jgi:hypothetical protein
MAAAGQDRSCLFLVFAMSKTLAYLYFVFVFCTLAHSCVSGSDSSSPIAVASEAALKSKREELSQCMLSEWEYCAAGIMFGMPASMVQ